MVVVGSTCTSSSAHVQIEIPAKPKLSEYTVFLRIERHAPINRHAGLPLENRPTCFIRTTLSAHVYYTTWDF